MADSQVADDVVQDALVLALERPPRVASGAGLRAWLSRVVRTGARQSARAERRRRVREERSVEDARNRAPAAEDVVQRAAQHRRVAEAVLTLEEPYRSAVLHRYLDGLEPVEIARRAGISPAAARQRVARGLARLRERFEREDGPRWARALVPVLAAPLPPTGSPLTPPAGTPLATLAEGAAMSTPLKLAGTAAAAAVLALTWNLSSIEPEPSAEAAAGAPTPVELAEREPGRAFLPPAPGRRDARPASAAAAREAPAEAPSATRVRGLVLTPDGDPAAGAHVRAAVPIGDPDSPALAGARVFGPNERAFATRADDAGRFALELEPGTWSIWAGRHGHAWVSSDELGIDGRKAPPELVLRLAPLADDQRIVGRVLDPDGQPVAGAPVSCSWPSLDHDLPIGLGDGDDRTDADGRFLVPTAEPGAHGLRVLHPDWVYGPIEVEAFPGDELQLAFEASAWIEVLARPAVGGTLERFQAAIRTAAGPVALSSLGRLGGEGKGALLAVPSTTFHVSVHAQGFAPLELGPFEPWHFPEPTNALECELARLGHVRGTLSAGGEPIAGGIVQLVRHADPRETDYLYGFPVRLDGSGLQGTYTDESGYFELPIGGAGEYALFGEADDFAPVELGPFRLDPKADFERDLALTSGGSIEGRVHAAALELDPEVHVTVRASRGDLRVRETRAAPDGSFRLDRLTPGPWMIRATVRSRRPEATAGLAAMAVRTVASEEDFVFPWDCEVREGEVTWVDLRLDGGERAVRGAVSVDGVPERYGVARLFVPARTLADGTTAPGAGWGLTAHTPRIANLDLSGRFDLGQVERDDEAWIAVELAGGPLAGTHLVLWMAASATASQLGLDLASAELALGSDFAPGRYAALTELAGATAITPLPTGPDGLPRPTPVPAGRVRVVRQADGVDPDDPRTWPESSRLELSPGTRAVARPGE